MEGRDTDSGLVPETKGHTGVTQKAPTRSPEDRPVMGSRGVGVRPDGRRGEPQGWTKRIALEGRSSRPSHGPSTIHEMSTTTPLLVFGNKIFDRYETRKMSVRYLLNEQENKFFCGITRTTGDPWQIYPLLTLFLCNRTRRSISFPFKSKGFDPSSPSPAPVPFLGTVRLFLPSFVRPMSNPSDLRRQFVSDLFCGIWDFDGGGDALVRSATGFDL